MSSKEISASTTLAHKKFQPLVMELTTSYVRGQATARNLRDWRVTLLEGTQGRISGSVGDGWQAILERAFEALRRNGWDGSVPFNVTLKHAGLRIVLGHPYTMKQLLLVGIAQVQSFRMCSRCGEDGQLTFRGHLAEILCLRCLDIAQKEDPDGNQPAYRIQA